MALLILKEIMGYDVVPVYGQGGAYWYPRVGMGNVREREASHSLPGVPVRYSYSTTTPFPNSPEYRSLPATILFYGTRSRLLSPALTGPPLNLPPSLRFPL